MSGSSKALAPVRERFELTPRSLEDDELTRIARGDRGCLGDLLSGLGAITLVTAMALGAMGKIPYTWAYVGVALWIGGFFYGTWAQTRSGKQRKLSLESGPLVLAVVMDHEDWLGRPGKRVGRGVALFTTDPARRFDRDWLEQAAIHVQDQLATRGGDSSWTQVRALLANREAFGVHQLPTALLPEGPSPTPPTYVASVLVHPERLEGAYLGGDDDREAAELELELDGAKRLPTLVAIVDPEAGFIEQVPRLSTERAKA